MIRIKNHIWNVVLVPRNHHLLTRPNGTKTIAVTIPSERTIYLANNLPSQKILPVLTHELCHAFCYEYVVVLDELDEEILCDFISKHGSNILNKANMLDEIIQKQKKAKSF